MSLTFLIQRPQDISSSSSTFDLEVLPWRRMATREGYESSTAPIPMFDQDPHSPHATTAGGEIATQVRSPACDTQWHGNKQQACRRNSRPRRFTRTLPGLDAASGIGLPGLLARLKADDSKSGLGRANAAITAT